MPSEQCSTHTYKGGPRGKNENEASHINDGSSPLSVFLLFFAEIITLLVVETNRYYDDNIDRLDDGPSPEPDVTEAEMFVFLALTLNPLTTTIVAPPSNASKWQMGFNSAFKGLIQMGHGIRDKLTDYWATVNQLYTPFYGTMMKWDQYLHILRYLHFTGNKKEPDRTDENFDSLWKIRDLFEILNATFSKFYNPSKNLRIDEVIVSFKRRVIFKQYIP